MMKELKMFKTKGEFIQALKDYNEYTSTLESLKSEYDKLEYLRFDKVKSALDYEVVGYENGEQMRSLKTRSYTSSEDIAKRNESLDNKLEKVKSKISNYELAIQEVDEQLLEFKEPMRSVLKYRYIKGETYNNLIIRFSSLFPVGYPNAVKRYIDSALDKAFDPHL